jgi:hypothetical protein
MEESEHRPMSAVHERWKILTVGSPMDYVSHR